MDPSGTLETTCIRNTLQTAVETAIGSGLTFSGFDSTDGIALVAMFYRSATLDSGSCDATDTGHVLLGDCQPDKLVAAAGFGAPLGTSTYDITCVSCQDSPHAATGQDNEPCPATVSECFLARMNTLITPRSP
jgi:hypothetical protein